MRDTILQTPLWQQIVTTAEDRKRCTVATSSRRQHINTVHMKPASTLLWGGGGHMRFSRAVLCPWLRKLDYSSTAKHLAWLGRGDFLQVPWCKRFHGLVVVINLWSGFGCALYALLAAGNRVIALTTEHSDDGTEALLCAFPAAVHLKRVEDVHAEMLQPFLRRRSASVILVGGKISCHTSTSDEPHQLARLVHNITSLFEVRCAFTQVVGWLETTSSVPEEVKYKYDELLHAQHF